MERVQFSLRLTEDTPNFQRSHSPGRAFTIAQNCIECRGLYGLGEHLDMTEAGENGSGSFTLKSEGHSIKLYAGTTALLQQTEMH